MRSFQCSATRIRRSRWLRNSEVTRTREAARNRRLGRLTQQLSRPTETAPASLVRWGARSDTHRLVRHSRRQSLVGSVVDPAAVRRHAFRHRYGINLCRLERFSAVARWRRNLPRSTSATSPTRRPRAGGDPAFQLHRRLQSCRLTWESGRPRLAPFQPAAAFFAICTVGQHPSSYLDGCFDDPPTDHREEQARSWPPFGFEPAS